MDPFHWLQVYWESLNLKSKLHHGTRLKQSAKSLTGWEDFINPPIALPGKEKIKTKPLTTLFVYIFFRHKVAILIPYRNRNPELKALLHHLHPFLRRQEISYGIYVVEQVNPTLLSNHDQFVCLLFQFSVRGHLLQSGYDV